MQLTLLRRPAASSLLPDQPGIVIRPVAAADIPALADLFVKCSPEYSATEPDEARSSVVAAWCGEYGKWRRSASMLAEVEGDLCGAVFVVDDPPWEDVAGLAFVIDLFVAPSRRGQGLAERLLRSSLATMAHEVVGLRVDSDNIAAVPLYLRLGFAEPQAEKKGSAS